MTLLQDITNSKKEYLANPESTTNTEKKEGTIYIGLSFREWIKDCVNF